MSSVVDSARKVDSKTGRGRMVRCKATSKRSGEPCKRWAVDGATVCPMHGAAKGTPARRKAEEQLKAARDELMEMLLGIARNVTVSASDRLKAITWALERAGFKGSMGVDITVNPAWTEMLGDLFKEPEREPLKAEAHAGPPVIELDAADQKRRVDEYLARQRERDHDQEPEYVPEPFQPEPMAERVRVVPADDWLPAQYGFQPDKRKRR